MLDSRSSRSGLSGIKVLAAVENRLALVLERDPVL
jgi:hypothetical protein